MIVLQRDLVSQAVADDSKRDVKSALNGYTEAIEYFIPAIECKCFSGKNKGVQGLKYC